jgi:unsaturated rhamnogalacturonyl hydrolase
MALVDALAFFPPSHSKHVEALTAIARRLVVPLLKYQDVQSGLWYQVMDRGQSPGNYLETSASSMFVYFLLKMIRLGLVPESDTEAVNSAVVKAYQGLMEQKVQEDNSGELHLTGICKVAGLGGTPYRDGSYEYYINEPQVTDDFKGVGPFILASIEYEGIR